MPDRQAEGFRDWQTERMRDWQIGRLRDWETAALERAEVIECPTEEPARSGALPLVEGHPGSDSLPGVTRTTRTDSMWPAVCKDCVSAATLGASDMRNSRIGRPRI